MHWWLIIGYVAIGGIVAGVMAEEIGHTDSDDMAGICLGSLLWPLLLAALIVMVVMAAPIWLGRKIHKYFSRR